MHVEYRNIMFSRTVITHVFAKLIHNGKSYIIILVCKWSLHLLFCKKAHMPVLPKQLTKLFICQYYSFLVIREVYPTIPDFCNNILVPSILCTTK